MARIILYHPWVYLKSGLERTLFEIAQRSKHDVTIHTSHFDPAGTYPELSHLKIVEHERVSVKRTYKEVLRATWSIFGLRFAPEDYDVLVISCDGLGPLLMFRNGSKPAMNLVFTPLRAVYDEVYRAQMLQGSLPKKLGRLIAEMGFKILDKWAWRRFNSVISISETVTNRIVKGGLFPREKVVLSFAGIDADKIGPGKPPEKYFFLPGRIMWTKNIDLALDAFAQIRKDYPEWELIIGGMVDAKSQEYFGKLSAKANKIGGITFRRDLSDAEMLDLYDRCTCVVMTALNEDQGLTPLEGAMRNRPSIAINRGGPKELIMNGETGLLVEPDVDSYAKAMRFMMDDPARAARLGANAQDRVGRYTWQNFVKIFDEEIDRITL